MIPLIILNFNQLFYLKNLINWWKWYYPENPVHIIDNNSNYINLIAWYGAVEGLYHIKRCSENNATKNLKEYLETYSFEYYVISDPDIMPHPSTPHNFLDYFKAAIDQGYHRAGFDLITHDITVENKYQ